MTRSARIAVTGVTLTTAATALWIAVASWCIILLLYIRGLLPVYYGPRWWAWLVYLPYRDEPETEKWLVGSGVLATVIVLGLAVTVVRAYRGRHRRSLTRWLFKPAPNRAATDNYGHARWATMREIKALFSGPTPEYGGIVVGEAYRVDQDSVAKMRFDPGNRRTWGRGGRSPLLIDPCNDGPTHSLMFAATGGFKTTGGVIPDMLHWHGSAVVLDPSCEVGPMVARARRRLGHKVVQMRPGDPDSGFNVLSWINTKAPGASANVRAVTSWICEQKRDDKNSVFDQAGRNMITCLLADMLWNPDLPAEMKTLETFVQGIRLPEPEFRQLLKAISETSHSMMARSLASTLMGLYVETFSGAYFDATQHVSWLFSPENAELLSGSAFTTDDLVGGKLTVFVNIPLKTLDSTPAVARVAIGALMNSVVEADTKVKGRVLFELDEAARLGNMRIIEAMGDTMRKYGGTLRLWYQSEAQLLQIWGQQGAEAWFDRVSWRGYAAIGSRQTAKGVSGDVGLYSVLAYSESENYGSSTGMRVGSGSSNRGNTRSSQEISRPLIRPEELIQGARADELFIIPRAGPPIRCGRAVYFRRPEMLAEVDQNRFSRRAA